MCSESSPTIPTTRSLGTTPDLDQQPIDAAFAPTLQRFATTRADELRRWFGRRYQMNEVGRCTQIALAVGVVAAAGTGPASGS